MKNESLEIQFLLTPSGREQNARLLEELLEFTKETYFPNIDLVDTNNLIPVMHQIENAFWYWSDNYVDKNLLKIDQYTTKFQVKHMRFPTFVENILQALEIEKNLQQDKDEMVRMYKDHRHKLPSYGAVLLNSNQTKTLLVRNEKSWNFPGGKFEEDLDSDGMQCAIREVNEEINFDITENIDPEMYITKSLSNPYSFIKNQEKMWEDVQKHTTLYIIPNIDEQTVFKSNNQEEIKEIEWFSIKDIPVMSNGFIVRKFYPELKKKLKELQFSSAKEKKSKFHRKRKQKALPNQKTKKTSEANSSTNLESLNDNNGNHELEKKRKTRKRKLTTKVETKNIGDKRNQSGKETKEAKRTSKTMTPSQAATTKIDKKELDNNIKKKKKPRPRNKKSIKDDENSSDDMKNTIEDKKAKTNRRKKKTKKECNESKR